jgi:Zn-dependent peptidase ImmA (M78 family)
MLLNASEPMVRQRFSVFHELKHVLDHPNAETFYPAFGSMTSKQRQEQIADYFAACALMPRVWINRAWRNDIQDVADLARLFHVSREAMRYRLNSLGLVFPTLRCEVAA